MPGRSNGVHTQGGWKKGKMEGAGKGYKHLANVFWVAVVNTPGVTSPYCILRYAQAAIAQLGERQTEDLKVPGSIPGLGIMLKSPGQRPSASMPCRPNGVRKKGS